MSFKMHKIIFFRILKDEMSFKMHKIIFFPRKKKRKKYVHLPCLKFSDPLPETHLFSYLALSDWMKSELRIYDAIGLHK